MRQTEYHQDDLLVLIVHTGSCCGFVFEVLLVFVLGVWVREPHSVCTPCTPEGYIHCWLTGLFPWLPLQVFALFATAKSSVEVYKNVSESDFWCRGFKRKPSEQLRHCICFRMRIMASSSPWKSSGLGDRRSPETKLRWQIWCNRATAAN